ncbi:sigma-70 family RNA polymerase sigma factor [Nocardia testacea]|uniref:sigma-70 family RNA polymerase sigma factor n=1 Tax=Nocardia testacea TaxID=248551 RepID=UPI00031E4CEE|nr:sigma-70 family RNA polymerase sigma factor [Nocardia testacea]
MQKWGDPVSFGPALGYETDTELVEALAAQGYPENLRTALEHQLWLYGWRVLRGMVQDLSILRVETGLPSLSINTDDYRTLHDSTEVREELVLDTLAKAVPFMINQLVHGKWDPSRSASSNPKLGTYFVTACAFKFRDVYKAWHRRRVEEIRVFLAATQLADPSMQASISNPDDITAARSQLRHILRAATFEERLICAGLLADKPHTDIAADLGISAKALEGRLYRLRQRTWEALGAAPIRKSKTKQTTA